MSDQEAKTPDVRNLANETSAEDESTDQSTGVDVPAGEVVMIAVDQIDPNPWNPQEQTEKEFNALVENIRERGFVAPIQVAPCPDSDRYRIVHGEHRWQAARTLGMTEIPCVVLEDWDEDMQRFQSVKLNILHGKLDPIKFTKLVNELSAKYSQEAIRTMMGFVDEAAFRKLYRDVKRSLPQEIGKKLDQAKKELKDINDLAMVLNTLFREYGETLDHGYMMFTYGGQVHWMIRMDRRLKEAMGALDEMCRDEGRDMADVMAERLAQ